MPFQFNPPDGFKNKTAFPTTPASEDEFRAQMWAPFEQVRDYINQHLPTLDTPSMGLYRNAIINGGFDIWQRGTSFSNPAYNSYFADRWKHNGDGTLGTLTVTRQEFTPGQTDVPGNPRYYLRYAQTVAGTGQTYRNFQQLIENAALFAGQTVTVSFYAKAVSPVVISLRFFRNFGTGGSPSPIEAASNYANFVLTTAWQKFTATLQISSVSGKMFGTNKDDSLMMVFGFPINSAYTIDIAQVQLCAGDVALPFQPRSFAEELMLCQRYYEKSYNIDTPPGTATDTGSIYGETENGAPEAPHLDTIKFGVRKRSTPTVIIYGTGGTPNAVNDETADRSIGAGNFAMPSEMGFRMNYTLQNATSGRRWFHYIADAEL